MHQMQKLKNGLTLITVNLPHLDSVTSLVAIPAGSRYETKKINGISHFLEHMFFKGSKKYPSSEIISTLIDGMGAVNNAATSKEWTYFWVKSSAKSFERALEIFSSMLNEPLFSVREIEKEKDVIIEEMRMRRDNPTIYVWDLYEQLQLGDQPLGLDTAGQEEVIKFLNRENLTKYVSSLYNRDKMVLVFAGKLPKEVEELAEKYFFDTPKRSHYDFVPFKPLKRSKPRVNMFNKKTDQANLVLGVEGVSRRDKRRYAAGVLGTILGEGMSSRLFLEVREKRGLAYHVETDFEPFLDTGIFACYAGLKLEKVYEGLQVMMEILKKIASEMVPEDELKKAKEIIRGRLAIRQESTNFLAQYFGINYILDGEIETFDQYLKNIDAVTAQDLLEIAQYLFKSERYNLQVIGPFKSEDKFVKLLT